MKAKRGGAGADAFRAGGGGGIHAFSYSGGARAGNWRAEQWNWRALRTWGRAGEGLGLFRWCNGLAFSQKPWAYGGHPSE